MEFFKKHIILADTLLLILLGILVFTNVKSLMEYKAYDVENATEAGEAKLTEYIPVEGLFGKENMQPVYVMELGGVTYNRNSLVAEKNPSLQVGDSVAVLYDADEPAHFYTETEIKYADNKLEGYQTRTFLFGGVMVVMIIVFIGDITKKIKGGTP